MKPISHLRTAFVFLFLVIGLTSTAVGAGMNSLTIKTGDQNIEWSIELASDDESRSTGLMFRKSMAKRAGMLFRFENTRPVVMWMKNTYIPLDMLFADETGTITHIHRGAVPHSLARISSQGPVRYVLEVNAGEVDETGIKIGDRMIHPWFRPLN